MSAERAEEIADRIARGISHKSESQIAWEIAEALADAQREVERLMRLQEDYEGELDALQQARGELILMRKLRMQSEQRAAALEGALRKAGVNVEVFLAWAAETDVDLTRFTRPAPRA